MGSIVCIASIVNVNSTQKQLFDIRMDITSSIIDVTITSVCNTLLALDIDDAKKTVIQTLDAFILYLICHQCIRRFSAVFVPSIVPISFLSGNAFPVETLSKWRTIESCVVFNLTCIQYAQLFWLTHYFAQLVRNADSCEDDSLTSRRTYWCSCSRASNVVELF